MDINFEEIPSEIEVPLHPPPKTRTVPEELNARQYLLNERSIRCGRIKPLYPKIKKPPHRYNYNYFCICPRYNPKYVCKHKGNIIIDRDVLTPQEHIVHLATPKANLGAPRLLPRWCLKKSIIANSTPRILRLAKPDLKQVNDTLNNFKKIISRRHKRSLKKCLEKSPAIEYTTVKKAVDLLCEENRLKRVAKRKEKIRCKKLALKIYNSQKNQIKKIVCILFEEMKEFLLNDQFTMNENSSLATVILETLRDFTDKEFYITSNLREYQKILAFNLAVWINKFISNLNIHVAETAPPNSEEPQIQMEKPEQDLSIFLPVSDYILNSSSDELLGEDDEDYYSYHPKTSERTLQTKPGTSENI